MPLEVWRFCDGKAGHERQTAGLVAALARRRAIAVREIAVAPIAAPWWHWLRRSWPEPPAGSTPALLVGAGRACQWPLLAARRCFGGRIIYCMKPGLPVSCFDLCLIPQHDNARVGPHVEPTFGVLNDIALAAPHAGDLTLIMIGGPSRHHDWDDAAVLRQIARILDQRAGAVVITDSRRTPPSMQTALQRLARDNISYQPGTTSPPAWLAAKLAAAREAWVTADSVSMVFEALTAGVGVGLIDVPVRRRDRIARLGESLVHHGQVTAFRAWQQGEPLSPPQPPINEAARCADLVLSRWSLL